MSDLGRVRNDRSGRLLKPQQNEKGYLLVTLAGKRRRIHRLVIEAFGGPIDDEMEVDHIDGNKQNNALSNLRVVTPHENIEAAKRSGLYRRGEDNPASKLSEGEIRIIWTLYRAGISQAEIARLFGVSRALVSKIILGKLWAHATERLRSISEELGRASID